MTHVEHLRPPILWWVVLVLVAATFVIAVAVFLPGWAVLVSLGVAAAAVVGLLAAFTATVRVTGEGLSVGRSTIEWRYVGEVTPLTSDEVRRRMGPGADPRSFVAYRSFAEQAVEITVDDLADPHPYWLVSTHDASRLAGAIEAARAASAT
ncbi:MAG: DUF3093 domain-containing protein, partial [Actinobacteria bacterium]|nr:DUF3093 domain-containing protein [Actinomycetota bacterium]